MTAELDAAALREEIAAVYGVGLAFELFHLAVNDAARVVLADRLAGAISRAGPNLPVSSPLRDRAALAGWTPLPTAPSRPGEPAQATARLLAWARAGGADVSALEIRTGPDGYRTAHAARNLATGERVLHVPRALWFDLAQVRTPVGEAIANLPLASDQTSLAVALIAERRDPDSRWRPYLDALPDRFPGLPTFQDAAALAPLVGSPVLDDVARRRRAVLDDHAAVVERVRPWLDLSLAELAWGCAIAASRVFATELEGAPGRALIPIADALDHGTGDVTYRCDAVAGGMEITAARSLAAGEEIHLSYGRKSNARLFSGYGFCVPDNPADVARVVLPRPEIDIRGDLIARLVWNRPLGAPWEVQVGNSFDDDFRLALSQARLAVATERELMIAHERGCLRQDGFPWLGERNEVAAWEALATAAGARLAAFSALSGDEATPCSRAVNLLLRGERQVLAALPELVAEIHPRLPGATCWDLRRLGDAAGDGLLGQYLRQVATELP